MMLNCGTFTEVIPVIFKFVNFNFIKINIRCFQVLFSYLTKDPNQLHKVRNTALMPVLSWSLLMTAYKTHDNWPETFVFVSWSYNFKAKVTNAHNAKLKPKVSSF